MDEIHTSFISMEPCGHQLLFTFTEFYLRFLFALHGQMVPCSLAIFEQIKTKTYPFHPTTSIKDISWQCAIIFPNPVGQPVGPQQPVGPVVLLVVDHNRIDSCYFLLRSCHSTARDPNRNCDPRLNWHAYQTQIRQSFIQLGKISGKSIFEIILQNKACFNGFGLSLATEALHRSRIHPMWSSQLVFQTPQLRERLLQGLKAIAMEDIKWNKHIQKHVNLDDPFHYNERAIHFYQQYITQVYNKQTCLVPTDICTIMVKDGLLVYLYYLTLFANISLLCQTEKGRLQMSSVEGCLFTKFGESINRPAFHLTAHPALIPILSSKLCIKLKIQNIIYIRGISMVA
jgi:hypothetical protein